MSLFFKWYTVVCLWSLMTQYVCLTHTLQTTPAVKCRLVSDASVKHWCDFCTDLEISFQVYLQHKKNIVFNLMLKLLWSASKQSAYPVWHLPIAMCTVLDSWWWTEKLSETCRVLYQKYIWEIVHVVGFYYKNISRCTVLWMSKNLLYFVCLLIYLPEDDHTEVDTCRRRMNYYYYFYNWPSGCWLGTLVNVNWI